MIEDDPRPRSSKRYRQAFHRGFGKSGPRLQTVPIEEFIRGHGIDPFRNRRRNRIEHEALHPPPFFGFVNYG